MPNYPGLTPCALSAVVSPATPQKFMTRYIPGKGTYRVSTGCLQNTMPNPLFPPRRMQFSTRNYLCSCVSTR